MDAHPLPLEYLGSSESVVLITRFRTHKFKSRRGRERERGGRKSERERGNKRERERERKRERKREKGRERELKNKMNLKRPQTFSLIHFCSI